MTVRRLVAIEACFNRHRVRIDLSTETIDERFFWRRFWETVLGFFGQLDEDPAPIFIYGIPRETIH